MSNWIRNSDGSIEPVRVNRRRNIFRTRDVTTGKQIYVEVGSEKHEEIKSYKKARVRTRARDVEVPWKVANDWYRSEEWKTCREKYLQNYYKSHSKRICNCCGKSEDEVKMNVDHIYPVRRYWHMRLYFSNLQNLCANCNREKANYVEEFVAKRKLIKRDGTWQIIEPEV
jgi:5-methylcytosine-specific restriction protein A